VKRSSELADLLLPWAGLVTGVVSAGFAHQFGSEGVFDRCISFSPGPLLIVSVIAIAATAVGALASWGVLRKESETPARKVVAAISVGASALFVLAMILPMIAAMVIPPCFE
jgi:hypothetical protein